MNFSSRDENIYLLRKSGITYAGIAKTYGISRGRVQQIYFKLNDFKENSDSWPPLKRILSSKAQNALIHCFKDEQILEKPEKILSSLSYSVLRTKIQFIGKKTAKEISQALITLDLLKPDDKWFRE